MAHARITPIAIALTGTLMLVGCNNASNESGAAPQSNAQTAQEPDVYTGIMGEIIELPVPGDPSTQLQIHHQQIEDFKTKDGTVNINSKGIGGMPSMKMPFPVGDGVSLEGLEVGDKVSFDFAVNWGGSRPAWEITRIEKLPDETEIDYTNKVVENFEEMKDNAHEMMDHSDHDHQGP